MCSDGVSERVAKSTALELEVLRNGDCDCVLPYVKRLLLFPMFFEPELAGEDGCRVGVPAAFKESCLISAESDSLLLFVDVADSKVGVGISNCSPRIIPL